MKLSRFGIGIVAGYAAVVMSSTPGFAGQLPTGILLVNTANAESQSGMAADMAAKCQAMMADHEKMMAEMKDADQRLDELVGKMNAASGMEKANTKAAVVNEMVTQRRTMKDGMMKDQYGMMDHMMEHLQADKDSMAMCPMMKQMGGMKH
jgi:hypothetical protein